DRALEVGERDLLAAALDVLAHGARDLVESRHATASGARELVAATNRSRVSAAAPESIASRARLAALEKSGAASAAMSAAAAFTTTSDLCGPASPENTARAISAFRSGTPPASSSRATRSTPKSSGVIVLREKSPPETSTTMV